MSSFDGIIREYPFICVDNFTQKLEHDIGAHFLSHCHADHMTGLARKDMANARLYCSAESIAILGEIGHGRYSHVIRATTPLYPGVSTSIDCGNGRTITVTAYPANHCPGSLMFIFQGNNGTVLYTGDFRFEALHQLKQDRLFLSKCRESRFFTNIYMDTTFMLPSHGEFPKRDDIANEIVEIISKLSRGTAVFLDCRTSLGYELIFERIFERFGKKVHVSDMLCRVYNSLARLGCRYHEFVTSESSSTNFHACDRRTPSNSSCVSDCENDFITIKPTAMFHRTDAPVSNEIMDSKVHYRLAFSMHSSFNELIEFASFLRPGKIYPIVKPQFDWSLKDMIKFLSQYFREDGDDMPLDDVDLPENNIVEDHQPDVNNMQELIEYYKIAIRNGKLPILKSS